MTVDLASVTSYELIAFTFRRIDAFASLLCSLDESLSEAQRDAARNEFRYYPQTDCGASYRILEALGGTVRVRYHDLIAQHFLAVLSVNSPPMRTTLLHCERLWAQQRGVSAEAVLALYRSLWHCYSAVDVFNAPEPLLVTMALAVRDEFQTMTSAAVRAEVTYGLNTNDDDGVVIESNASAPLSQLAYRVRVGFGGDGEEAIRRTVESLQYAVSYAYMAMSEHPDERDERELLINELECWVVELPSDAPSKYLVVLFPSLVVAGNPVAMATLADLRECPEVRELWGVPAALRECPPDLRQRQLWAMPVESIAWDCVCNCNFYYCHWSGRMERHAPVALSLRPSREQWRRFVHFHERLQAYWYTVPTLCAPLHAPTASAQPSRCAPTYTIFKDGDCTYVRHIEAPDVVVDESGRVLEA